MALTFTKKIEMSMGDKAYRLYEVTADGSTSTINATDINLHYIDHAILSPQKAALSSVADYNYLSESGASIALTMAGTGSSAAVMDLQAWGW
jgi:hypothetical protein